VTRRNIKNLGYVSTETIANLKDFVFNGPVRDQGCGFHRQAERGGSSEDPGVHSGHRGRDTAERKKTRRRKGSGEIKLSCARRPLGPRAQHPSSERGDVLHQHPAAVLDLMNMVVLGEVVA